jgi:hypothetical protein
MTDPHDIDTLADGALSGKYDLTGPQVAALARECLERGSIIAGLREQLEALSLGAGVTVDPGPIPSGTPTCSVELAVVDALSVGYSLRALAVGAGLPPETTAIYARVSSTMIAAARVGSAAQQRIVHETPPGPPLGTRVTRKELDKTPCPCGQGPAHPAPIVSITAACHPQGRVIAMYQQSTGVVALLCGACGKASACLQIAWEVPS